MIQILIKDYIPESESSPDSDIELYVKMSKRVGSMEDIKSKSSQK
jgi:hypothetical protein